MNLSKERFYKEIKFKNFLYKRDYEKDISFYVKIKNFIYNKKKSLKRKKNKKILNLDSLILINIFDNII